MAHNADLSLKDFGKRFKYAAKACALMSENLSMIKRPIVVYGEVDSPEYMAGFDADKFEEELG